LAACPSDLLVLLDDLGGVDPPVALVPDQNEVVDRPVPPGVVGGQLGDAHRGPAVVDRRLADLELEGDVGLVRGVLRPRLAGEVPDAAAGGRRCEEQDDRTGAGTPDDPPATSSARGAGASGR